MVRCSIMGTDDPHLSFVDLPSLFRFRGRWSILLLPRAHDYLPCYMPVFRTRRVETDDMSNDFVRLFLLTG